MKQLFDLYDLDGDQYLDKQDVLTMLYNYPKEVLKDIANDELFINRAEILKKVKIDIETNKFMQPMA